MQNTDTPSETVRWDRLIFDTCIDCLTAPAVGCSACKNAKEHAEKCIEGETAYGLRAWNPRCSSCHKKDVRAWAKDAGLTYYVDEHGDPYTARRLPPQPVSDAIKRHKAWVRAVESRLRQSPDKITKAEAAKLVARVRSKGRKVEHGRQLEIEGTTVTLYNDQGRLAAWRRERTEALRRRETAEDRIAQAKARHRSTVHLDVEVKQAISEIGQANNAIHALELKLGTTPNEPQ